MSQEPEAVDPEPSKSPPETGARSTVKAANGFGNLRSTAQQISSDP